MLGRGTNAFSMSSVVFLGAPDEREGQRGYDMKGKILSSRRFVIAVPFLTVLLALEVTGAIVR